MHIVEDLTIIVQGYAALARNALTRTRRRVGV